MDVVCGYGLLVFAIILVILVIMRYDGTWPFGRKERKMRKKDTDEFAFNELDRRTKALEDAAEEAALDARRDRIDPLIIRAMWTIRVPGGFFSPIYHISDDIITLEYMQKMLDAGLLKMVKPKAKKK